MTKNSIKIDFLEYDSTNELAEGLKHILNKCENKLQSAYAPYSMFKVSSACELDNGEVVYGTNQENVAYPSGICAERVAVFSAKSDFPNQNIKTIVVTTQKESNYPFTPCGACRQVLMEYEQLQQSPIEVVLKSGNSKIWKFHSVSDILPFAFEASTILKKQ